MVWVCNDSLSDCLYKYLVYYVVIEIVSELVGFVYIHCFVAFLHMRDKAIDRIEHEFIEVEFGLNLLVDFLRHKAQ
jgi:hypothetical protein